MRGPARQAGMCLQQMCTRGEQGRCCTPLAAYQGHLARTAHCVMIPWTAGTATVNNVQQVSYSGLNDLIIAVTLNIPFNGGSGGRCVSGVRPLF